MLVSRAVFRSSNCIALQTGVRGLKTVLVYGDSNTWGYNPDYCKSSVKALQRLPYPDRWTTQCQQLLGSDYQLIVEGLNSRTTTRTDLESDGEYDCNGRATLPVILHSHKPLDLVIIALGANDFKTKFGLSVHDIAKGVRTLVRDVDKQTNIGSTPINPGSCPTKGIDQLIKPKILVIGPPFMQPNAINRMWGIPADVDKQTKRLSGLLTLTCKDLNVAYLPLGSVASVSEVDGVHYPISQQPIIAQTIAKKIQEIL